MEIKIYAEDIIKLCLWDSYVYYILGGSDKEAERILKENAEIANLLFRIFQSVLDVLIVIKSSLILASWIGQMIQP